MYSYLALEVYPHYRSTLTSDKMCPIRSGVLPDIVVRRFPSSTALLERSGEYLQSWLPSTRIPLKQASGDGLEGIKSGLSESDCSRGSAVIFCSLKTNRKSTKVNVWSRSLQKVAITFSKQDGFLDPYRICPMYIHGIAGFAHGLYISLSIRPRSAMYH